MREKTSRTAAQAALERVGRRPSAEALAAVRRDLGLGPTAGPGGGRAVA